VHPGRPRRPALTAAEGPRSAVGLTWRLRGGARLRAGSRTGRTSSAGTVRLRFLPTVHDQPPTVAYAVGRAVGTAVVRTRVRRRLRALVTAAAADGAMAPGEY